MAPGYPTRRIVEEQHMDTINNLIWAVIGAIFGAIIKYFVPGTFHDTLLYKRWRARQEHEAVRKQFEISRGAFQLGPFQVENMSVLQFLHGLREYDIRTVYDETARQFPPALRDLEYDYLPYRKEQLENEGRTVDYNDTYSLRKIRIERPQVPGSSGFDRRNTIELQFEPSNFKYNLMVNEALDKALLTATDGKKCTIRQYLGLESFDWSEIPNIPIHMWFSTVVGVVTADNQFVLALRSGMQAIRDSSTDANIWRASMSCAEGMLRPVDSENGLPSPFKTAERALYRELGLRVGEHYVSTDLQLIAMCFDTFRYQPLAVFLLELPGSSFQDVQQCWMIAPDRHENVGIIPIEAGRYDFADLLVGRKFHEGRKIILFSNHQKVGVVLTGCKLFKVGPMTKALSNVANNVAVVP